MTDERALFAAICADPEEDTPRLAYADWLDEHAAGLRLKTERASAAARAALIRVQCELARLPPDDADADAAARRIDLEDREGELLRKAHALSAWAPPGRTTADGFGLAPSRFAFVRGFPDFASGGADRFRAAGAGVFDISPLHRLYCQALSDDEAPKLLTRPWLSRVRRFGTYPHYSCAPGWSERVFAAPPLANLEHLALSHFNTGAPGAPVAARPLAALRHLELEGDEECRPGAFARFAELLPDDARVRDLSVGLTRRGGEGLSTADLRDLAAVPQFRALERLALDLKQLPDADKVFTAEGARALAGAPWWPTLRALEIKAGGMPPAWKLGATEVEALAAVPPPPHLRTLRPALADAAAFLALAQTPLLGSVTALSVEDVPLTDAALAALARSPRAANMVGLHLRYCHVGPKGVRALAGSPLAANLVDLDLSFNTVGEDAVDALVAPGRFPRLRRLTLSGAVRLEAQKQRLRDRFGDAVRL